MKISQFVNLSVGHDCIKVVYDANGDVTLYEGSAKELKRSYPEIADLDFYGWENGRSSTKRTEKSCVILYTDSPRAEDLIDW